MNFQLIIPKSSDECLKAIKESIPYYYDIANKMGNIYSYKLQNDKLLIMSQGVGYVPVILEVELTMIKDNETKVIGLFTKSILSRLIIWFISFILFFVSMLTLLGILTGEVSLKESPILTISIPLLVLIVSTSYFCFTEIVRKMEKKAIVKLISNLFSE